MKIKPFLILQLRPEDEASDNELESILKFAGLKPDEISRVRLDKAGMPEINLTDISGIIVGGGPSNISDSPDKKGAGQKKIEKDFNLLLDKVTKEDFPYLGTCYGLGILAHYLGGSVSKEKYSESVGAVTIKLTEDGKQDKVTASLNETFKAFAGHKEACQELPPGAVLLAGGSGCPIQAIRYKNNVYATQFHPELDQIGLEVRINTYRHAGYFPPEDAEMLIAESKHEVITEPEKILKNFVNAYRSYNG